MRLPSRLKFASLVPQTFPAWTESISRRRAVVRLPECTVPAGQIRSSDEIALEIDLPERRPFSPRCLHCEGRVGFVTRKVGEIRLGMIVDRMHFRTALGSEAVAVAEDVSRIGKRAFTADERRLV